MVTVHLYIISHVKQIANVHYTHITWFIIYKGPPYTRAISWTNARL